MRKRSSYSLLEIFQDPLLTIIALVLLSTVWMIIPKETAPYGKIDLSRVQGNIEQLKIDIESIEIRIEELRQEIKRGSKELRHIERELKEAGKRDTRIQAEIDRLTREIERIRGIIEKKKEELERLNKALEQAGKEAEEARRVKEIDQEISRLKGEIKDKIALLNILKEDLDLLKKKKGQQERKRKEREYRLKAMIEQKKRELERLKRELERAKRKEKEAREMAAIIQEIKELKDKVWDRETRLKILEERLRRLKERENRRENEKRAIDGIEKDIGIIKEKIREKERELEAMKKAPKGTGVYDTGLIRDKRQVRFEAVNNRVVVVNENNYDVTGYPIICGGRNGLIVELVKGYFIQGDSITDIDSPDSEYQRELSRYDPSTEYINFVAVHSDSFPVFIKAREKAFEKGFAVSWLPNDKEKIVLTTCGGVTPGARR